MSVNSWNRLRNSSHRMGHLERQHMDDQCAPTCSVELSLKSLVLDQDKKISDTDEAL